MDRLYSTVVTTASGVLDSAPNDTPWPLEDALLQSIEIVIPDGHAGLTGIRILQAGAQIIPFDLYSWINGNNERIVLPFNGEMTATGLIIETYNTGTFAHSHYVRAVISDLPAAGATSPAPTPLSSTLLSSPIPDVIGP